MKTLLGTQKRLLVVLGILGCGLLISLASEPKRGSGSGKVEILKGKIILHPTVKLSPKDKTALDTLLSKFKKNLYKIETLEKGKVATTRGTLSDAWISESLKAEVANAKAQGWDYDTDQFVPSNPDAVAAMSAEAKELFEKVEPILKKYK